MVTYAYPVDESRIAAFERDGAVHLTKVIDERWLGYARDASDQITGIRHGSMAQDRDYFDRSRLWMENDVFKALCTTSVVPQIAAQLMRTKKVNLFYDQLFAMRPGSNTPTPWHNDLPYWPISGRQAMTVWLAFDPIIKDNGALEFIRGSHLWDLQYEPFVGFGDSGQTLEFQSDEGYTPLPDFDGDRAKYELLTFDLEPGDAIAFHSLVVHCAYGNSRPDMKRRGYAMRVTGEDVRYMERAVPSLCPNDSLRTGDVLDSAGCPVIFDARTS